MDDFKDPKSDAGEDERDEEETEEEDVDLEKIKKEVKKSKGKKKVDDIPHSFDVHTANEVFSADEEHPDPRFDEDDPEINDSDQMSDDEDELESGTNFFAGPEYGRPEDILGFF